MPTPTCTDAQFLDLCRLHRSAAKVARVLHISERAIHLRRNSVQNKTGQQIFFDRPDRRSRDQQEFEDGRKSQAAGLTAKAKLPKGKAASLRAPGPSPDEMVKIPSEWRYQLTLRNGTLIVGSDAHYKPDCASTAHRAMVLLTKALKPKGVIMNGDLFDASSVSRHFRIRWHQSYTVKQEIEACQERMGEVEAVAGNAFLCRTWGNHDSNFETRLSGLVPEYEGLGGFTLWEHLPRWQPCMSVFVNDGPGGLVIKHRFKGGMHAPHNNVLWAGRSMTTGHLHSQKVQPLTDYNGTKYGTDSGCLATPDDEGFHYAEDDPRNWRSGFSVHTFNDGIMMPPDLATVIGKGRVWFRGEMLKV